MLLLSRLKEQRMGRGSEHRQRVLTKKRRAFGRSAHLSSLSTPFSLMQLPMMMADADAILSRLFERSIFSVGFVPLSSSIGSA